MARVRDQERTNLKRLPLAVLWAGVVVGIGVYSSSFKSGFGFMSIVAGAVLATAAFRSWKNLKVLNQSDPYVKSAANFKLAESSSPDALKNRRLYDRLLTLTKPRRTRVKSSALILLAIFACIAGVALWTFVIRYRAGYPKSNTANAFADVAFFLLFGLISTMIVGGTIRSLFRDRHLLSDGDIAIAVITSQEVVGGKSKTSRIKYDFKDAAGRGYSGKSDDESRELYEDMQTIVFYNRDNPAENVPIVGAMVDLIDL